MSKVKWLVSGLRLKSRQPSFTSGALDLTRDGCAQQHHDSQHSSHNILLREVWPRITNLIGEAKPFAQDHTTGKPELKPGLSDADKSSYYLQGVYQVPGTELDT